MQDVILHVSREIRANAYLEVREFLDRAHRPPCIQLKEPWGNETLCGKDPVRKQVDGVTGRGIASGKGGRPSK
jgi:hypothetical protein